MLYPLKFKPILKQTIWGGDKLAYKSNDPKVKESIGESWEISGVQDNISVVSEGALEGNSLQELNRIFHLISFIFPITPLAICIVYISWNG